MAFAAETDVPVGKSRGEIEALVEKYGASRFASGWGSDGKSAISFVCHGRMVRFEVRSADPAVALTVLSKRGGTYKWKTPTEGEIKKWVDQENRRRWRCLLLAIKAKLEIVQTGIATFEEEFLAHVVTPNNMTVYERMKLLEDEGTPLLGPVGE